MYQRPMAGTLRRRLLEEPRRFMQIVLGPRQVGKTTCVGHALKGASLPVLTGSADTPGLQSSQWLAQLWNEARTAHDARGTPVILFLDEIQKVTEWSSWVKRFWDEDSWDGRDIRVVLTGSSPLLMQHGLSESLAGRFEVLRASHWTFTECREAFGWDLDTFIYYGGYPGSAPLVDDPARWREYVTSAVVETSVSRDILLMTRIDKPALLRQVFSLACEYAGQILTFEKMLGQLQDAGNTTTIAHYLELLDGAGMVTGLQKYSAEAVRRRRSSPKFVVHNTALVSAFDQGSFEDAKNSAERWGRLAEAAVGAHLKTMTLSDPGTSLHYWRDRRGGVDYEVDYVLKTPSGLTAIEVKSGESAGRATAGLAAFVAAHPGAQSVVVGTRGIPFEAFFENEWVRV